MRHRYAKINENKETDEVEIKINMHVQRAWEDES
jgi:hypothetical protein